MSRSGQVNFTKAKEILQNEPVMAGMFTIDSHLAYMLFDYGASHSFIHEDGICTQTQYTSYGYTICL